MTVHTDDCIIKYKNARKLNHVYNSVIYMCVY